MKIGDRVRFLSDVGGGIVKGFQNNNKVVLVEDEDGFQMPVLASDVVVVTTDDYNIAKVDTMGRHQQSAQKTEEKPKTAELPAAGSQTSHEDDEETDLADKNITYKPKPVERANGDKLSVYLAFVPVNPKEFTTTTFETYIVNDCNYYINYIYLQKENNAFSIRQMGIVEPNTKVFVEEIEHSMLNEIERVCMQLLAYKQDRPFLLKLPICVELKIDTTKFFKYHTFRESLFFEEPTLEYVLVKDDVLPTQTQAYKFNATEIQQAMLEKKDGEKLNSKQSREQKKQRVAAPTVLEVDLHASELLSTTAGMSSGDIKEYQLNVFRKTMNEHLKHKGMKIVFIHGKGEGALRSAILYDLKRKYRNCTFQDASFEQYGFGATMVIIH